ncbi:MAG: AzlD domain-containing protein [Acutalibacteraceae bacterium]|nr:AzlD domain-containing protein [Acutalibacteraceae bacterium]
MDKLHSILLIVVMASVTFLTRALPFIIFNGKRETPKAITYLGTVLPFSIMGMLIVYCFKDVSFFQAPFGLPQIIAIIIVAVLHIWKRNTLLSIVGGTISYMLLVQMVFI